MLAYPWLPIGTYNKMELKKLCLCHIFGNKRRQSHD
jgi:hypothetical protein